MTQRITNRTHAESAGSDLYIDLVKRAVLGTLTPPRRFDSPVGHTPAHRTLVNAAETAVKLFGVELRRPVDVDPVELEEGRNWTDASLTMIGWRRLDNIHRCVADVLDNNVRGDFIEAGVWRGGAAILMPRSWLLTASPTALYGRRTRSRASRPRTRSGIRRT